MEAESCRVLFLIVPFCPQAQASVSQKGPVEVSKGQPSGPVPATKQKLPLNPWKPPGLLSEVGF